MTRFGLRTLGLLSLASLLGVPRIAGAALDIGNCTGFITSIPTTISTPGTWCFNQNLTSAITFGNAITINTDNVTIDCNDFTLNGLSVGAGTGGIGIRADNRADATVRHCNVRGFYYGILFLDSGNSHRHLVEDNRLDKNTLIGIEVDGHESVVRRNRVFDTGGSTISSGQAGIAVVGSTDVLDNTVSGVAAAGGSNSDTYGIQTSGDHDSSISGNRVRGVLTEGTGTARGIGSSANDRISLRNNELVGDANAGSVGFQCDSSAARAKDNVIKGFGTGIIACSNDGGNVIKP